MPLTALRLVNPPGRRRRKPFPAYSTGRPKPKARRKPVTKAKRKPLKRVVMGKAGVRYRYGGKLISAGQAKRIRAARKTTGTKPRTNPSTKRKTSATSRYVRSNPRRKTATKRRTTARRKTTARKKVSAATRRKISLALKRHHRKTTRVASNPPKRRRKTVAKKRTTRRRRPVARRTRTNPAGSAKRRAAAKKAAATRKRNAAKRSAAAKKAARTRKRGTTARKRTTAKRRVRRNPGKTQQRGVRFSRIKRPGGRKRYKYRVKRTTRTSPKGNRFYRYSVVRKNPGLKDVTGLVKKVLPIYGGFVAARILKGAVQQYGINKLTAPGGMLDASANPTMAKVAPALAPAATFLLSVFAGPMLLKGKTGRAILEGLQMGSLMTTLDTLIKNLVGADKLTGVMSGAFGGYDDVGIMGYGAYLADPTGYSLPPAHQTMQPGMGLDVNEAMALNAYVADDGMNGYGVEEALADSESAYMESGGAGGTLARTVFANY